MYVIGSFNLLQALGWMVVSGGPTLHMLFVSTTVIEIYSIKAWKSVLSPNGKAPGAEDWRQTAKL